MSAESICDHPVEPERQRSDVYLPIKAAMAYLWVTFAMVPLVSFPGKQDYPIRDPWTLTAFITVAFGCFYFGYVFGATRTPCAIRMPAGGPAIP